MSSPTIADVTDNDVDFDLHFNSYANVDDYWAPVSGINEHDSQLVIVYTTNPTHYNQVLNQIQYNQNAYTTYTSTSWDDRGKHEIRMTVTDSTCDPDKSDSTTQLIGTASQVTPGKRRTVKRPV